MPTVSLKPIALFALASSLGLHAQAIRSIDSVVANANNALIGRIATLHPEHDDRTAAPEYSATLTVDQSLTANHDTTIVPSLWLDQADNPIPLATLQRWQTNHHRLLLGTRNDEIDAIRRTNVIDLDAHPFRAFSADLNLVTQPSEAIRIAQAEIARNHDICPPLGAFAWTLTPPANASTDLPTQILVPLDARLQCRSQAILSGQPGDRASAVLALANFEPGPNRAFVDALLDDPTSSITYASAADRSANRGTRFYYLRADAFQVLQSWHIHVPSPILTEPTSAPLATTTPDTTPEISVDQNCKITPSPNVSPQPLCRLEAEYETHRTEASDNPTDVTIREHTFVFTNRSATPFTFVVHQPIPSGWVFDSNPKPDSIANNIATFRVFVDAHVTTRLHVGERLTVPALDLTGTWQGLWHRPTGDTRVSLIVRPETAGSRNWVGTLYLVDQPGLSIPIYPIRRNAATVTVHQYNFDHPDFTGAITPDGDTITGTWLTPEGPTPLDLTRFHAGATEWLIHEPTIEQLHQYILTAARRTQLIGDHTHPFHLTAQLNFREFATLRPLADFTFDELYRDPTHWKLTLDSDISSFTEVRNGAHAYTLGTLPFVPDPRPSGLGYFDPHPNLLNAIEAALFRPIDPVILRTLRLRLNNTEPCITHTASNGSKHVTDFDIGCIRITVEPQLPGVPASTPVATSVLELGSADLLPYSAGATRSDFVLFDNKSIARTLYATTADGRSFQLHLTTLEPATDFSAITASTPAHATAASPRRQDLRPPTQITYGQLLQSGGGGVAWNGPVFQLMCRTSYNSAAPNLLELPFKLYIDANGAVTSVELLVPSAHFPSPALAEKLKAAIQQGTRFSLSYRDNHPTPIEFIANTGECVTD